LHGGGDVKRQACVQSSMHVADTSMTNRAGVDVGCFGRAARQRQRSRPQGSQVDGALMPVGRMFHTSAEHGESRRTYVERPTRRHSKQQCRKYVQGQDREKRVQSAGIARVQVGCFTP